MSEPSASGARYKSLPDKVFDVCNIIFMVCLMIVTLYPFVNMLAVSFNDANDSIRGGIYLWPRMWTLENYNYIFSEASVYQATLISVLRTVLGTVISVFCTAMLAYTLTRPDFVLRKFMSVAFIFTMYFSGGLIPGYLLIKGLGLTNSFWVYILPAVIGVFNLIVIRSFIEGLPEGLLESARIDGAGEFATFLQIVLPLTIPALATVSLFVAVGQWNSWFDVFLYNSSNENLSTLQYELQKILQTTNTSATSAADQFASAQGNVTFVTPTSIRATMTIIASVPIILVYPFLQKYFVKGLTVGGVKG
ncbi:carbohydrate ABC transporter permease [Paenibacillus mucilaginosus]|uniref:Binding-protein-dependent transport systems inner membrane component n=3 Tax=Paenibacillus mucilaginosus TaxID=61624 RepID=H6NCA1_9BACL|nr:carbohydrate ABC transporter permease [Paenibacillus mucilaginosus]AEI42037.1 binding-protein-dependent transport systems inner membrane component [Paenibacillus mucilaginosus KNP414]AFC28294.1 binding-protein-dependent transport systems inner membrane component [Paenibacillus mucilaginosus 3016]AFH60468.1 sugar ABC transporter permease [Paenibacillus mucilaginosus K02]MCG7217441.1 carbohydrate ABC transporter permease [Paenibacillus mucilaginosus]WDM28928.1 carbohydrate ABC transporter per